MKNLLARLGEQYAGTNICVTILGNYELRRMFDVLLDEKTTMADYYTAFGRSVMKYGTNFLLNTEEVDYPCLLCMQDGELSLHTRYIEPEDNALSVDDFIELFT